MKIAVLITRTLLGLIYLVFGAMVLFHLVPMPPPAAGPAGDFQVFAGVYFMTFLKIIECLCGLMLIINKYTPLILVIIFPVTVNIFLFHAFLEPSGLAMAVPMLLINLFLGYAYRKYYAGLFTRSATL